MFSIPQTGTEGGGVLAAIYRGEARQLLTLNFYLFIFITRREFFLFFKFATYCLDKKGGFNPN